MEKREAKKECLKSFIAESVHVPYEREIEALKRGFDAGYSAGQSKWVRIEDRSPEKRDWYLVTSNKTGALKVYEAEFADGAFNFRCVLAWQPLPQPYDPVQSGG